MFTVKKDDFDESMEDIMNSINNILNKDIEINKNDDNNKDKK